MRERSDGRGPKHPARPLDFGGAAFCCKGGRRGLRLRPDTMTDTPTLPILFVPDPRLRAKAELARIGHYYATESMLVWDAVARRYDAAATPAFGTETLWDHYEKVIRGEVQVERGDHAVF